MKLYYVATLACTVLITGCVISNSPSELRNDVTPIEYNSVKSAKVLALCALDEWEKRIYKWMKVQMRETSNGYSVWGEQSVGSPLVSPFSMKDNAMFVVDIDNTKTGSIAHYYIAFSDDEKYWVSTLEKCLNDTTVKSIVAPEISTQETSSANSSVSQKLRELQELKKDGLITEDEFQNKKKQLLDKL